ncbi:MAG: ABC transporter permease [Dehalococcoidia bacterium]|nr:ABC transporter permease [Dehalococcoidia bacterium]MYI86667.1 ABC transporter permease [Dehalococcoidia bacterium]
MTDSPSRVEDMGRDPGHEGGGGALGPEMLAPRRSSLTETINRLIRYDVPGAIALAVILLTILIVAFGTNLTPYTKDQIFTEANPDYDPKSSAPEALNETRTAFLASPSGDHWLGTDTRGRDLFTRLIHGSRISVPIGVGAAFFGCIAGSIIGLVSGLAGGKFDLVLQRFVDAMIAFPPLVLLLLIVQVGERSFTLTMVALSILVTFSASRVIRAATMRTRGEVFIEAARSVGASRLRIMVRHIFPNVIDPIIVIFSISIGTNILAEASLAFLNLSVPGPSWGQIVNEGRAFLDSKPMMSISAGVAITVVVLSFNILGDATRDWLDPRQRTR